MSAATPPTPPGHRARAAWARALVLALTVLTVLTLLVAPLAAAPSEAAAPPPAAASSCEPGELQQDAPEAALRLPTGHPTRLPTTPLPPALPDAATHLPSLTDGTHPTHRALRTVVLRC
ncbi:hypothetical protein AB0J38_01410 [Streptomyces sp. NPDC050095]|uniref:hypothetical protein n=1 Tax=unclassified Streptomyces TaxID=2593676 RepID=UPI003415D039